MLTCKDKCKAYDAYKCCMECKDKDICAVVCPVASTFMKSRKKGKELTCKKLKDT